MGLIPFGPEGMPDAPSRRIPGSLTGASCPPSPGRMAPARDRRRPRPVGPCWRARGNRARLFILMDGSLPPTREVIGFPNLVYHTSDGSATCGRREGPAAHPMRVLPERGLRKRDRGLDLPPASPALKALEVRVSLLRSSWFREPGECRPMPQGNRRRHLGMAAPILAPTTAPAPAPMIAKPTVAPAGFPPTPAR